MPDPLSPQKSVPMKTSSFSSLVPIVWEGRGGRGGVPLDEGPVSILGLCYLGGEAPASVESGYFRIWVNLGAEGTLCPRWALSAGLFNTQHFMA